MLLDAVEAELIVESSVSSCSQLIIVLIKNVLAVCRCDSKSSQTMGHTGLLYRSA